MLNAGALLFFSQIFAEWQSTSPEGRISPAVGSLLSYIWDEASGQLAVMLKSPIEAIKLDQLEEAESVLLSIRRCLTGESREDLNELSSTFYKCLPHTETHSSPITTLRALCQKQDLCQVSLSCVAGLRKTVCFLLILFFAFPPTVLSFCHDYS